MGGNNKIKPKANLSSNDTGLPTGTELGNTSRGVLSKVVLLVIRKRLSFIYKFKSLFKSLQLCNTSCESFLH